jgi:hypothetical protein
MDGWRMEDSKIIAHQGSTRRSPCLVLFVTHIEGAAALVIRARALNRGSAPHNFHPSIPCIFSLVQCSQPCLKTHDVQGHYKASDYLDANHMTNF